jgi:predicted porin
MKKFPLALAMTAAMTTAGIAHADEVAVYGLIDAGVEYLTNATPTKASQTRVISGGKNTSRWGVRGSEDLGGGLKATFQLEGGVLLDTGNLDGVLFKRQSNVGLEGDFGKVVVGRSFTTAYDFLIQFDPLGFAPNYSWSTSGSATGPSKYGMTTAFDNLIKYSVQTGDLKFGATVGLGEQATGAADSRKYSVGGSYKVGALSGMVTYEGINGNVVPATGRRDITNATHVAFDYRQGQWRIDGGLRDFKLESGKAATADIKATTWFGGASYLVQPNITLTGAVYYVNVKNVAAGADADPTMVVARALVAMSKTTDLYVAAAHAKAKNGKLISLSRDDAGFGSDQTGITAGIQKRF